MTLCHAFIVQPLPTDIPTTIKRLRLSHEGLSQQCVCIQLRSRYLILLTQSGLSRYESGSRPIPAKTYVALLEIYGNNSRRTTEPADFDRFEI